MLLACSAALGARPACAATYSEELRLAAQERRLAEDPAWRRLLHFRRNLWGLYRSEVDDPHFFYARHGAKDPAAELDATLAAFFQAPSPTADEAAQCRFPARYAWLKEQLHFDPTRLPEISCPRFEAWRRSMDAGSVTVVFASYYMNNPASMYGHTFLRLNGRRRGPSEHLLDYTVNYMADVTTNNGILFAIYGLTGGYRGRFSTMPYYMKVQEYNNMESRDLWEYQLALSSAAVERLVEHLWEMGSGSTAYFFFNKNCSYELLPTLEVADPRLHLVDRFRFKAIPSDTLRAVLAQPGLVTDFRRRPSHVSRMLAARQKLSLTEIRTVEKVAQETSEPAMRGDLASFTPARQAMILDSAYDLFRYRRGFAREQPAAVQQQERRLLLLRNQVGLASSSAPSGAEIDSGAGDGLTPQGEEVLPPHLGHKTGRASIGYAFTNRSHLEELGLRPAIHDPEDPPESYIPGSQLQMLNLRLRYDDDRRTAYLQEFSLADLVSLSPLDRWVRRPSWKVNTGFRVAQDLDRDPENSLYYGLNGGSGFSVHLPVGKDQLLYAMAIADLGVGAPFRDRYRFGGGGSGGLLLAPQPWWRLHFEGDYLKYPVGQPGEAVIWRLIQSFPWHRAGEARVTLERQNRYKEVLFSLLVYL